MAVALVTGAEGGIGRAIVAALAGAGWTVAGSDLPTTGAEYGYDLRDPAECRSLIEEVVTNHGGIDLLVNNAASMTIVELSVPDMTRWWQDLDVNLSAPFRLVRAAAESLRKSRGQVINIASVSGVRGEPGFSAYAASKAGLIGLTKSLARELAPDVRVNAVAPGHTDTPQLARDAEYAGITLAELRHQYEQEIPIGRLVQPDEVAGLVTYLASATGFTGACVHLNGGLLMP
jgi:NAD(P)-dependent dehydrogenase (short-subunit alcohol dehydrogenase family)